MCVVFLVSFSENFKKLNVQEILLLLSLTFTYFTES